MTAEELQQRLLAVLSPAEVAVQDDSHEHAGHAGAREGRHFTVHVRSSRFTGLNRLARHRLVYDAAGPLAAQGVHALAIVAQAPGEG
jgi:BolA protein